jgi:drug/metabolite transporter superfamily protein YnfA
LELATHFLILSVWTILLLPVMTLGVLHVRLCKCIKFIRKFVYATFGGVYIATGLVE